MMEKMHDAIIGGGDPFAHFYSTAKDYDEGGETDLSRFDFSVVEQCYRSLTEVRQANDSNFFWSRGPILRTDDPSYSTPTHFSLGSAVRLIIAQLLLIFA